MRKERLATKKVNYKNLKAIGLIVKTCQRVVGGTPHNIGYKYCIHNQVSTKLLTVVKNFYEMLSSR